MSISDDLTRLDARLEAVNVALDDRCTWNCSRFERNIPDKVGGGLEIVCVFWAPTSVAASTLCSSTIGKFIVNAGFALIL